MNNKETAQKVVDRMLEMIEQNNSLPWVKPWNRKVNTITIIDGVKTVTINPTAWNRNGVMYRGVNTYLPNGEYITYNQCKKEGGQVKKGAKGFPVVYWNFIEKKTGVKDEDGNDITEKIPVLKYYTVFNVNDCEGIEQKHNPQPQVIEVPVTHEEPVDAEAETNSTAEQIIADYIARSNGLDFKAVPNDDRAYYSPSLDIVRVPHITQFADSAEYYSTTFHELGHSTGHKSRLDRFGKDNKSASFGTETYSKEELVAEITASTILNSIGLENGNTFRNNTAYVKSWASHIKNDPLMYISAMTKAINAVDMIMGI